MSKKNQIPDYAEEGGAAKPAKKKKGGGLLGRIVRRFFLLLFTAIILVLAALILAANMIFKGPSPAAQELLTMTLLEPSATKWIPGLFIGDERVAEIKNGVSAELPDEASSTSQVVINRSPSGSASGADEWADYPDGIRFVDYAGGTYNAHIMIVRDPSQVYVGLAYYDGFSMNKLGKRANQVIEEQNALAIVNGGAFNDDGTGAATNGSLPQALVYADGECRWTSGNTPNDKGFVGFNTDDVLVVHKDNITEAQAKELNIRDGVCFGPVLIMNGEPNMKAYNDTSGLNPRTAIGQRADGAVVFVCIDGRQAGSMGGTFADVIDIMTEYGVVNACNLDGGSSSIMMYRDTYGRYGEPGQIQAINNYSLLQSEPRRMPNFWMVRPAK